MRCVTLPVKSDAVDIKTLREYVAKRVIEFLEQNVQIPSEARVLCFLDDRAVAELKAAFGGAANRGFHWPIRGQDSVTGRWIFGLRRMISTAEDRLNLALVGYQISPLLWDEVRRGLERTR